MASLQDEKDLVRLKKMCYSKTVHRSWLSAEYALDSMVRLPNSNKLSIYKCPACNNYHIGKINKYLSEKLEDHANNSETIFHNSGSPTHIDGDSYLSMAEGEE